MREALISLSVLFCAIALRLSGAPALRKLGAFAMMVFTFLSAYFLTGSWIIGLIGGAAWFLLPLVDLLSRVRHLSLPLSNDLPLSRKPRDEFFPNAREAIRAMEDAGFEHVEDAGWDWAGMHKYVRIFWHPEELVVGTVNLCEQQEAAFAFVSLTSRGIDGGVWRTTNFPFSPGLKCPHKILWNHLPCEQSNFDVILREHHRFLRKIGKTPDDLRMPDPDEEVATMKAEMREQLLHNHSCGLLDKNEERGEFRYTTKGLLYLWWQQIKDMVRLC